MAVFNPTADELNAIYESTKTIAVVGASFDPGKDAHRIPAYLRGEGFRVIPVTPKDGEIFGETTHPSVDAIGEPVDVVLVFRPGEEAPGIVEQAVRAGAKVVWLQSGIESSAASRIAHRAGLTFVSNLCMGATHARLQLGPGPD
jgi:predicted CoA-binding protein